MVQDFLLATAPISVGVVGLILGMRFGKQVLSSGHDLQQEAQERIGMIAGAIGGGIAGVSSGAIIRLILG